MAKPSRDLIASVSDLYLKEDLPPFLIARRLGASHEEIAKITKNLRRNITRAEERNGNTRNRTLNIYCSNETYSDLEKHARRRGISVSRLASKMLPACSEIVDAILDDEKTPKRVMRVPPLKADDKDLAERQHRSRSQIACDEHLADLARTGASSWSKPA